MAWNNPAAVAAAHRAETLARSARTKAIHEDYDDGIKKLADAVAELSKAIEALAR
ncbi:hypothetical protein IC744_16215 [Microbacterium hominis]|uniref:hypothetical protein n=1 Tax=Microbacterium hominis TaxID=162426 RepID=UPI00168ABC4D|nr:hypothetical protein [Microbacterium hominis]QOC24805.1 hypothetical protein IC745_10460 [Microbacterium hominis]QOC28859.1 hypothetical protein IC744_16215 [Microbacterium hominis]